MHSGLSPLIHLHGHQTGQAPHFSKGVTPKRPPRDKDEALLVLPTALILGVGTQSLREARPPGRHKSQVRLLIPAPWSPGWLIHTLHDTHTWGPTPLTSPAQAELPRAGLGATRTRTGTGMGLPAWLAE